MTARLRVATLNPRSIPLGGSTFNTVFDFGFATLQTVSYTTEPALDDTGKEMECNKVTLEVAGVVNRVAIATGKPPGVSSAGVPGDDMPFAIPKFRDFLMLPRLYIRFDIGDQKVLESPAPVAGNGPFLSCDVRGGPFPQKAMYTRFAGAKLAFLHYRVTTYVTRCVKYLLSHRYEMMVSIDEDHYSTRTTHGSAVFRKDFMAYADETQADDFRALLPPACPPDMRRTTVHIEENTDGSELDYTVVDTETTYGFNFAPWLRLDSPRNNQVLEINGTVTAKAAYGFTSLGDVTGPLIARSVRRGMDAANRVRQHNARRTRRSRTPAGSPRAAAAQAIGGELASEFISILPRGSVRGQARATGRKGSNQTILATIAIDLLMDRLRPVWRPTAGIGKCVAAALTFNLDSEHAPYCEATVQCIGLSTRILDAIIHVDPDQLINTAHGYTVKPPGRRDATNMAGPDLPATQLPFGKNTCGTWTGRLLSQILLDSAIACSVMPPPPANQPRQDVADLG